MNTRFVMPHPEYPTVRLFCDVGHYRELPHASPREAELLEECVKRRLTYCDKCHRRVVRVEKVFPS